MSVQAVDWTHSVDFRIGLDALYDIKETLEVLGGTVKAMTSGDVEGAMSMVMGSAALIGCLEVMEPDFLDLFDIRGLSAH